MRQVNVQEELAELEGLANAMRHERERLLAIQQLEREQAAAIRAEAKRRAQRKQQKRARKKNR